jgi:hypothetical protein
MSERTQEISNEELLARITEYEKGVAEGTIKPQPLPLPPLIRKRPTTIWDHPANAKMFTIGGALAAIGGFVATDGGGSSLLVIGILLVVGSAWPPKEKQWAIALSSAPWASPGI